LPDNRAELIAGKLTAGDVNGDGIVSVRKLQSNMVTALPYYHPAQMFQNLDHLSGPVAFWHGGLIFLYS
jgi:hypothetical protein